MQWEAERERRRPEGRKKGDVRRGEGKKAPLEATAGRVRMADAMAGVTKEATKSEEHTWPVTGRRIGGGAGGGV